MHKNHYITHLSRDGRIRKNGLQCEIKLFHKNWNSITDLFLNIKIKSDNPYNNFRLLDFQAIIVFCILFVLDLKIFFLESECYFFHKSTKATKNFLLNLQNFWSSNWISKDLFGEENFTFLYFLRLLETFLCLENNNSNKTIC